MGLRGGARHPYSALNICRTWAFARAKGDGQMRIAPGWFLLLAIFTGSAQAAFPQDAQQSRIATLENAWNQAHPVKRRGCA
jgi:hypothetical protein